MDSWTFIVIAYSLISVAAITLTYREQKRKNLKSPLFNLIGYVLCVVWPVTVAAILVAIGHKALVEETSAS